MRAMFAASPMPIWLRDEKRQLLWVNAAYVQAVGGESEADVLARSLELIDSAGRGIVEAAHRADPVFVKRLPAVVSGERRIYDVVDIASVSGSGGIAIDVTAVEQAEAALRREIDFNARTLDQLATAVAIFGAGPAAPVLATPPIAGSSASTPPSSIRSPTSMPCSTGSARRAASPSRRTTGPGGRSSSRSTARPRRASRAGTCPTARRSASSPIPTRRAA